MISGFWLSAVMRTNSSGAGSVVLRYRTTPTPTRAWRARGSFLHPSARCAVRVVVDHPQEADPMRSLALLLSSPLLVTLRVRRHGKSRLTHEVPRRILICPRSRASEYVYRLSLRRAPTLRRVHPTPWGHAVRGANAKIRHLGRHTWGQLEHDKSKDTARSATSAR